MNQISSGPVFSRQADCMSDEARFLDSDDKTKPSVKSVSKNKKCPFGEAAIRTCLGVAVGEDGVPNPTAQKNIRVIREIRAKK
jgi:hypothetical protein